MRVRQAREAADAERLRLEKEARLQKKREAKAKAKGKYIYRQIGIRNLPYINNLCIFQQQKKRSRRKQLGNKNNKMLSMVSSLRAPIPI